MLALTNALIFAFLGLTWSLPTAYPEPEPYPADLNTLEARQSLNPTRNELSGSCKPVTIIFARGTAEPGNVGLLAGPPWFNVLGAIIGYNNIAVQGVNYDASIPNYLLGGSAAGSKTLASLVGQAASKCPQTQIVVGGYSQGAQLVHNGLKQISGNVAARINAVVMFGDPDDGQPLQGVSADKVATYCFQDDLICKGAPIVLAAHLSYSLEAGDAAQFTAARVQV